MTRFAAITARAFEEVDGASLRVFRFLFGLLIAVSAVRFILEGWVERCFGNPTFFFKYWGFGWVHPLEPELMTVAYVLVAVLGLMVAFGRLYRPSIVALTLVFTWLELIDVTNYLNHYYLVSVLGFLLCFLPATARRVPRLSLWILRFQLGVVYTFAAFAKVSWDWLLHAQPLNIWLSSRIEVPVIGSLFGLWEVALVMGWAGFLHDLVAPWLLGWRRTRGAMYAVVVVFHAMTGVLFQIGIFPILMVVSTPIFFEPDWPSRVPGLRRVAAIGVRADGSRSSARAARSGVARPVILVAALAFALFQAGFPLRSLAYGGNVNWHEQGMRWAWKVMCRAKAGAITYTVHLPSTGRRVIEVPARYLTDLQEREFSGQPDLILQLAHHIGAQYMARGHEDVEVYVDARVSLNGRAPVPLIDPAVDLMTRRRSLRAADWILPAPEGPPIRLRPRPL
jgi:hypothetical protein